MIKIVRVISSNCSMDLELKINKIIKEENIKEEDIINIEVNLKGSSYLVYHKKNVCSIPRK